MTDLNKPIVFLDVDGVLLNYINPLIEHAKALYSGTDFPYPNQYNLIKEWGLSVRVLTDIIDSFGKSAAYRHLRLIDPTVLEVMRELKLYGTKFVCVTQVTGSVQARKNRLYNLAKIFPPGIIDDIVFTSFGENKAEIIARYLRMEQHVRGNLFSRHLVVEDSPETIKKCLEANLNVAAVSHGYNVRELMGLESKKRIVARENLSDILRMLLDEDLESKFPDVESEHEG